MLHHLRLSPMDEITPPVSNAYVEEFDLDTGVANDNLEKEKLEEKAKQVIYQASMFLQMKETEGWRILQAFIKNTIEGYTKSLILEQDFEKIKRLQSEILAMESVFRIVDESILDAEEAKRSLDILNRPE